MLDVGDEVLTYLLPQIIVGGGAAGLAVAARLSQRLPNDCILVIEAGPAAENEPKINIPGLKGSTIGTVYDWNFTTVPQAYGYNRSYAQTRGKVLGGSSALNLMAWDRASKPEYDAWEELGNRGWGWNSMIINMLKSENFVHTNGSSDTYEYGVGSGGPIQTLLERSVPAQQLAFFPAMENLGVGQNFEPSDGNPIGVFKQSSNIRLSNYTRSYSPTYLSLAGPNLEVVTNTRVAKINFTRSNHTLVATGVILQDNTTIEASKEVIVSAGGLQSPGLLELSGIGNASVLSAANITTLLNLTGVGENLQDHLRIQSSYQLKSNFISFDELRYNASFATAQMALYNERKTSIYDYTASGYAFLTWDQVLGANHSLVSIAKSAASNASIIDQKKLSYLTGRLHNQVPQLEIIFSDGYTGVKGYPAVNTSLYGQGFFTLIGGVQHTFSRGSVHTNSSDINSQLLINPHYLSNDYDLQALIVAAKYLRKIANTEPLKNTWTAEYEPGTSIETDAQWANYIRNGSLTLYHPLGTCAMLPRNKGGVVSPELKVYGTKNLRVVDASIIPILISAHIQTAVYGIAEKAADMIVDEWSV